MIKRHQKKWWILIACGLFISIIVGVGIYHHYKSLPTGISYEGKVYPTDHVRFLTDLTYETKDGERKVEQQIFEEIFQMIEEAEELVVIDMFLFNGYTDQKKHFPDWSGRLTDALIKQKKKIPALQVVFITDPINEGYHSYEEAHLQKLKDHDIEVIITNLSKLKDSNKAYSSVWRIIGEPFGTGGKGWLPNPFAKEAPKFTLRSYMQLFNVKANHRKVVITEKKAMVTSANPHNESGYNANTAFQVSGEVISDMLAAEQAVIDYSGGNTQLTIPKQQPATSADVTVQYVTEGKILQHTVQAIEQAQSGETIWMGMFYLANRSVIEALHDASDRDVNVKLILDPNKVAFGSQKIGLPNVPVANELQKDKGIDIRWYKAKDMQYHPKMMYIEKKQEQVMIGGSANFTTRNLDDLNLENDIVIRANGSTEIMQDINAYFYRLWNNEDGIFTEDYEANEGALTPTLKMTYWLQKMTGFTTY